MKQRLLLALLMLFSSVGFMKAQGTAPIKIAVPKEGKVTITLTSSTFEFTSDSYPQLFLGSTAVTPDKSSFKNKTVKVGSINSIFYFLHKAAEPFNCLEQDNLA